MAHKWRKHHYLTQAVKLELKRSLESWPTSTLSYLPRIDMCQCTGTQERQETVRRLT